MMAMGFDLPLLKPTVMSVRYPIVMDWVGQVNSLFLKRPFTPLIRNPPSQINYLSFDSHSRGEEGLPRKALCRRADYP